MRVKHKIWVNISNDTNMQDLMYGPDESVRITQTDAYDQQGGGSINIATTLNEDLSLVDVDNVKGIYMEFDQDVEIKLNGSSDTLQVRKANTTSGAVGRFFAEIDISAVNITAGSEDVTGHYKIWGIKT